jgi:hypothetical protein
MIAFESSLTEVAEPTSFNHRATAGMPSPGEEGKGEGELKTEPALSIPKIDRPSVLCIFCQKSVSRLQGCARLCKPTPAFANSPHLCRASTQIKRCISRDASQSIPLLARFPVQNPTSTKFALAAKLTPLQTKNRLIPAEKYEPIGQPSPVAWLVCFLKAN